MYNYQHEIKPPKDRVIRQYIRSDYFHDSIITNIDIKDNEVGITLSCEKEWPDYNIKKYSKIKKYEYQMCFKKCLHIEYSNKYDDGYPQYLNWRFKNSIKLKELTEWKRWNYLHLRIQIDNWYIDIIFHKFELKKTIWEIYMPKRVKVWTYEQRLIKAFGKKSLEEVMIAYKEKDWFLDETALDYLFFKKYKNIKKLAIEWLKDTFVCPSAIYILGGIWIMKDIKHLKSILEKDETEYHWLIWKKHIQDAIDKILYRNH